MAVSFSQTTPCVFVRPTVAPGHEHAILSQHRKLLFTLSNGLLVFAIAGPCFGRGPTPRGNTDDLKRIWQPFADQVDTVAALDSASRTGAFTVQLHMAAGNRCSRATSSLEVAAIKKPAVDAQGVCQDD